MSQKITDSERRINPSFSLSARDMDFINAMKNTGRFGSKTEVVRAALRMLEDHETAMETQRLQAAIAAADASIAQGKGVEYQNGAQLAETIISQGAEQLKSES